jgi:hypothetical protein
MFTRVSCCSVPAQMNFRRRRTDSWSVRVAHEDAYPSVQDNLVHSDPVGFQQPHQACIVPFQQQIDGTYWPAQISYYLVRINLPWRVRRNR